MTTTTIAVSRTSRAMAAEVRAEMGRHGVSQRGLANRLGRPQPWVSRRIGLGAEVELTLDDVAEMADALGIPAEGVIGLGLRARRDSNPKPSDLESDGGAQIVNWPLTLDRRYRNAWGLAS